MWGLILGGLILGTILAVYGNLFPAFTSFLDSPHLLLGDKLIVCAETADFV